MFEAEKSYQFLLGLNDDLYSQIRGQILAMEPLPFLEKIFNIVSQEEQHKKLMVGRDDRIESAFTVNHNVRIQTTSEKGACKHCRRFGHNESGCYEIVGYPPGWSSRGKGKGRGRGARGGRITGNRDRGGGRETACVAGQISTGKLSSGQQQHTEGTEQEE